MPRALSVLKFHSKMYSTLVWVHVVPARCTHAYEFNILGHPHTMDTTCCHWRPNIFGTLVWQLRQCPCTLAVPKCIVELVQASAIPALLHPCIRNNVLGHPRTTRSTCHHQRLDVLELWNGDCINTHAPSPFQSSKVIIDFGSLVLHSGWFKCPCH